MLDLALRDRSGHRSVRRERHHARAARRTRGAVHPRGRRRCRTQASTVVEWAARSTCSPKASAQAVLAAAGRRCAAWSRQVGDRHEGRAAAHTGKQNGNWAGSRQGRNHTVQANIMVGPEVVEAVAAQFESTEGTRMLLAER
jgi:hypothetical protein